MIPFPLDEIYYFVLVEGWRVEEINRSGTEIRMVVYRPDKGMDAYRKQTGKPLADCLALCKHLAFSLYGDHK